MQLNAKRRRKHYRTEKEYIRAVYQHNKKKIIKNADPEWIRSHNNNPYLAFKDLIEHQMSFLNPKTGKKFTASESIKRASRSKYLNKEWTTADIYARNFHSLITKDKELMELFYRHEGINRIEFDKYEFLGYYTYQGSGTVVYRYGDSYFIEPQSPKAQSGGLLYVSGQNFMQMKNQGQIVFDKYRKRRY